MISGEKTRLRPVEREDLPRYVEWINDPQVAEGLGRSFMLSQSGEEKWFQAQLEQPEIARSMAIDAREGDRWVHIGGCGLHEHDSIAHHAELGIMIGDRQRWGKGYGTDAFEALIAYAFNTLNLRRVYLRVFEYNERAIVVYQKLGFEEEGRLREDRFHKGRYWDTLIMGMFKQDWQEQRKGDS